MLDVIEVDEHAEAVASAVARLFPGRPPLPIEELRTIRESAEVAPGTDRQCRMVRRLLHGSST